MAHERAARQYVDDLAAGRGIGATKRPALWIFEINPSHARLPRYAGLFGILNADEQLSSAQRGWIFQQKGGFQRDFFLVRSSKRAPANLARAEKMSLMKA